jgi:hypothetical protein
MAEKLLKELTSKYTPEPSRHFRFVVIGLQDSGKTRLVKALFGDARVRSIDPFGTFGPPCASAQDALKVLSSVEEGETLIVDEWTRYGDDVEFTTAFQKFWDEHKHYGVDIVIMARKATQFPPALPDTASHLLVFASPGANDKSYLEAIARGLGDEAQRLAPYECILVDSQRRFARLPRINRTISSRPVVRETEGERPKQSRWSEEDRMIAEYFLKKGA